MLYKVSKKYDKCRETIAKWRQGDTLGYYTSQYDQALDEIKLKDKKTVIEIDTNLFYNGFCITLNHKKKITKIVEF